MRITLFIITLCAAIGCFGQSAVRLRFGAGGVPPGGGGGGGSALTNGVVAHWEMAQTGSTAEPDVMGDNDLTVSSGDTIPSRTGVVGNGRDWTDGEDDRLEIVDNDSISISNQSFTVGAWINMDSVSVNRPVIVKTNEFTLSLLNANNNMQWTVYNSTGSVLVASSALGAGTNYYVSAGWNSTNSTTWLMVVAPTFTNYSSGTLSTGPTNSTSPLYVGASVNSPTVNFDGVIDELTIWKGVSVSSNNVMLLYNAGSGVAWPWTGL